MTIYRRPKFLEILHEIREEMSREVDYDVDLFAETARTGKKQKREQEGQKDEKGNESLSFGNFVEDSLARPKTKI